MADRSSVLLTGETVAKLASLSLEDTELKSSDKLKLLLRVDYPVSKDAVVEISHLTTLSDLRVLASQALEMKSGLEKYSVTACAYGCDVTLVTDEDATLVSSGVRNKSTILWSAPAEIKPVEKTKKRDKRERAVDKDNKYRRFTVERVIPQLEEGKLSDRETRLAWEFIDIYSGDIVKTDAFLNAKKSTVLAICKSNTLSIEEVELFEAVVSWGKAECKRTDQEEKQLAEVISDIIPHIRFPQFATQDVATKVIPTGVLNGKEVLELFTYLGAKGSGTDEDSLLHLPPIKWTTAPRKPRRPAAWFHWDENKKAASLQLSQKNTVISSTTQQWQSIVGSTAVSKGVYEWEIKLVSYDTSNSWNVNIGVVPQHWSGWNSGTLFGYSGQAGWGYITGQGQKTSQMGNPVPFNNSILASQGSRVGVRLDMRKRGAGTIEIFIDDVSLGVMFDNINEPVLPAISCTGSQTLELRFPKAGSLGKRRV